MALSVVESKFAGNTGTIIIQSDKQEEVTSLAARHLALGTAAARLSRPGLSNTPSPYPVNAQGETSEDLLFGRNGQTVAAYRCDYEVMGQA